MSLRSAQLSACERNKWGDVPMGFGVPVSRSNGLVCDLDRLGGVPPESEDPRKTPRRFGHSAFIAGLVCLFMGLLQQWAGERQLAPQDAAHARLGEAHRRELDPFDGSELGQHIHGRPERA